MTSEEHVPDRDELVAELRSSGSQFVATIASLPAATLEEGRYEGGWNGRQILAHVAAIEWTYPRLLEIPSQAALPAPSAEPPTRAAQGGIDAYNARQVEKRSDHDISTLLTEFQRNREATIAAVAAADPALFAAPIRSAGGVTGPLGAVIRAVAVQHILGHARPLRLT